VIDMKDKKRYSEAFKLKVMEELRDSQLTTLNSQLLTPGP